MKVGIVLLSKDGYYLGKDGKLPKRLKGDKQVLKKLMGGQVVLVSENTLKDTPQSFLDITEFTTDINSAWYINFGISTFKYKMDLFIVVKSKYNLLGGKKFDLTRFNNYDKVEGELYDKYYYKNQEAEECLKIYN